jgi:hypothetical protein
MKLSHVGKPCRIRPLTVNPAANCLKIDHPGRKLPEREEWGWMEAAWQLRLTKNVAKD